MRRAVLGILASATLAIASPADSEDLDGWREAKWGMTPDQVQKALPYPTFDADLAKLCGEKCEETALELDDYELNGLHFTVRFWFPKSDKRLQAVSLYAKQLDSSDNQAYTTMKHFLESSYGEPQSSKLWLGYFEITWKLPTTTILLHSNTTNELTIVYEERTDKKEGKS